MKFKSKTKELKEVILSVSRAVDVKPSTPSLQGIYIKVEEGFCEVVGSDLDLVIKSKLKVDSMVDGECLISSRVPPITWARSRATCTHDTFISSI